MPVYFQNAALALLDGEADVGDQASAQITVRALIFYSGTHTDANGKSLKASKKRIQEIANASNRLQAKGRRVKFFFDHENSQPGVLGRVTSDFQVEELSAKNIPFVSDELAAELEGELGIFADITLAGAENIQQYQDGRLKEISAGIDVAGLMGEKFAIVEISAVGIQALTGAGLFAANLSNQEFALSLAEAVQERESRKSIWELFDLFTEVIHNIETAEDLDNRDELKLRAIKDLAMGLKRSFGVSDPPPSPPPIPPFSQGKTKMEDILHPETGEVITFAQYSEYQKSQFAALKAQNEQLLAKQQKSDAERQIVDRYASARGKANVLFQKKLVTPKFWQDNFKPQTVEEVITQYAGEATENREEAALAGLAKIEAFLDVQSEYSSDAPALTFGSLLVNEPLPEQGQPDKGQKDGEVAAYLKSRGYTS